MKLHLKFDTLTVCRAVLREQLEKLGIPFTDLTGGEVDLLQAISAQEQKLLNEALKPYGIGIIDDPRNVFVQKVRDLVMEMVNNPEPTSTVRFSDHMSGQLHQSYGNIAKIFSEATYTSIEHFIILQKIDKAKQLICEGELNLTEIAWRLNYSSVQHLSNQFKKTTGITPTSFQRIVKERRKILENGKPIETNA